MPLKILFIGGTGVISSACTHLCHQEGHTLYLLNRGNTNRSIPAGIEHIKGDIRDIEDIKRQLKDETFDVVVDWIAFTPGHVRNTARLFHGKTAQYIFISSASAYKKPKEWRPVTENTPLENPVWEYSHQKILCEAYLMERYHESGFPITIVRPSHTYDKTKIPLPGGYTALHRLLNKQPVILHGDGTSLWTLTHHTDFARGFLGVLGNSDCIGEAYHITSDEVLTWNRICELLAEAAGVEPVICHIPSGLISRYDKEWGDGLLGDKAHCMVFDNSKIKSVSPQFEARIPFRDGAREIVNWYQSDMALCNVDQAKNQTMNKLVSLFSA